MSASSSLDVPLLTASRPNTDPSCSRISSLPPAANSVDHSISRQHGYTSALEYTRHRLRAAKLEPTPDLLRKVEELTREIGYLRQENHFYRQCFEILQRVRENSYDVYQQLFLASYYPPSDDRLHELMVQLHHGLEDSVRREVKAEREWKAFWGIEDDEEEASKGELI
jgi:hypothetical protein